MGTFVDYQRFIVITLKFEETRVPPLKLPARCVLTHDVQLSCHKRFASVFVCLACRVSCITINHLAAGLLNASL